MTRPVFAPQKKLARVERSSPLRLLDCPGVAEMERRAVLDPSLAALSAAERDDAIIDLNESLFGDLSEIRMTGEQWDRLCEMLDGGEHEKAARFKAAGWDVTGADGLPLRMLCHYEGPLALAIIGVLNAPEPGPPPAEADWMASLERDVRRFRSERRHDASHATTGRSRGSR